jgi:hypothetical protein
MMVTASSAAKGVDRSSAEDWKPLSLPDTSSIVEGVFASALTRSSSGALESTVVALDGSSFPTGRSIPAASTALVPFAAAWLIGLANCAEGLEEPFADRGRPDAN